jgi:hypothetical protein
MRTSLKSRLARIEKALPKHGSPFLVDGRQTRNQSCDGALFVNIGSYCRRRSSRR